MRRSSLLKCFMSFYHGRLAGDEQQRDQDGQESSSSRSTQLIEGSVSRWWMDEI